MHGGMGECKSESILSMPTPEMIVGGHACEQSVIGGWMAYFTLPFSETRAPQSPRPLLLPTGRRLNSFVGLSLKDYYIPSDFIG